MKASRLIIVSFIIAFSIFSCEKRHERNILSFKNKIIDVQDSLFRMETLLSKLPRRDDSLNTNYEWQDKGLYLNGIPVTEATSTSYHLSKIYSAKEIQEILVLASYLNRNFVSSAYFDSVDGIWRFIYKPVPNSSYNKIRDICLTHRSELFTTLNDTILDHKARLYLVAPKDADVDR